MPSSDDKDKNPTNAYASPAGENSLEPAAGLSLGSAAVRPFAFQAARFSAYAPLAVVVVGAFVRSMFTGGLAGGDKYWFAAGLAIFSILIAGSGLVLGIIGFSGGVRLRAWRLLAYAGVGIVANAGLILLWFSAIL
ncbi:MAG: hypothetical protein AB7O62_19145 [Pirellulales bacterium]